MMFRKKKQKWIHERNLVTIKVYLGWADQAITEDQLKQFLISGRALGEATLCAGYIIPDVKRYSEKWMIITWRV